jgi:hypothetical protein
MSKVIIFLDKYSDWLETYSVLDENRSLIRQVDIYLLNNDRNDASSVRSVYIGILKEKSSIINIIQFKDKLELFQYFEIAAHKLSPGDFVVAPFIRYRDIWKLGGNKLKNIITVHISECIPDTFGHVYYRLGFKSRKFKTWATLPFAKIYAVMNKPDRCYFPFYPSMTNPFVKKTFQPSKPPLIDSKGILLENIISGENRTLLIGGFGYDIEKMASYLNLDKYIATSKGMEIIVDGQIYPLSERICAEEVLLSGYVNKVVSYNSSAVVWAKILYPQMEIVCYMATALNKQYGFLFNKLSIRSLNNIGIKVLPECKQMLSK